MTRTQILQQTQQCKSVDRLLKHPSYIVKTKNEKGTFTKWALRKLTEKVQHVPGEQTDHLLLQDLLRHLALLAHHLLLLLLLTTEYQERDVQGTNQRQASHRGFLIQITDNKSQDSLDRTPLVDHLPLCVQNLCDNTQT